MNYMRTRTVVTGLLCLAILSCCASRRDVPINQWFELDYIVDGRVDIQFLVPPAKAKDELFEPQFISTVPDPIQTMLFAHYDPGWWSNRDLLLTRITSTIIRVERDSNDKSALTLDYIKNQVYLARDDAKKKFDIEGEVGFDSNFWLKVNLIDGYRRGVSYSRPISDSYILILSMSVFGEDSDETSLFQTRHETLKKMVSSVKFQSG